LTDRRDELVEAHCLQEYAMVGSLQADLREGAVKPCLE
jgi:hypothetical protein